VLKDIYLSFYPGAKIGIVGENGSGKSTVLRIMAGLDDGLSRRGRADQGLQRGMVPQEPKLDPERDRAAGAGLGLRRDAWP
jgi:sulfate-transporting ATPase